MERLSIKFDRADLFDQYLEETRKQQRPECGDLEIITKVGALKGGKSGAMITFTVLIDGKRKRVQAVTTMNLLASAAAVLMGRVKFEASREGREGRDDNNTH